MSYTFPYVKICAGTAPRNELCCRAYSGSVVRYIKLESLILAQNERWRHA